MTTFLPDPCCLTFDASVEEQMILQHTLPIGGREATVYLLPPIEGDEARLIFFCPFCGRPVGEAAAFRDHLAEVTAAEMAKDGEGKG